MKHSAFALGLAVLLVSVFAYGQAATQGQAQPGQAAAPSATDAAKTAAGAAGAGTPAAATGSLSADELRSRLKQAGVSDQMALQSEYVMMAEVKPFDPAHVLAIKDQLKLTDDQVNKLNSIVQKTGDEAKNILNEDQRRQVQQIKPMTVAEATRQLPPSVHNILAQATPSTGRMAAPSAAPSAAPPATTPPAAPAAPGAQR